MADFLRLIGSEFLPPSQRRAGGESFNFPASSHQATKIKKISANFPNFCPPALEHLSPESIFFRRTSPMTFAAQTNGSDARNSLLLNWS